MRTRSILALLAFGLVVPQAVVAQEEADEDSSPVLRLSFFQCHSDRIGQVLEEAEKYTIPVWDELVAEGKVMSYGFFTHWWADEWNLGIYTVAPSIEAVVAAETEAAARIEERSPDAPNTIGDACPWHRDGFYQLGPSTGDDNGDDEDEEGGGA